MENKPKVSSPKVDNYTEKYARHRGFWQWEKIKEYIRENFKEVK